MPGTSLILKSYIVIIWACVGGWEEKRQGNFVLSFYKFKSQLPMEKQISPTIDLQANKYIFLFFSFRSLNASIHSLVPCFFPELQARIFVSNGWVLIFYWIDLPSLTSHISLGLEGKVFFDWWILYSVSPTKWDESWWDFPKSATFNFGAHLCMLQNKCMASLNLLDLCFTGDRYFSEAEYLWEGFNRWMLFGCHKGS